MSASDSLGYQFRTSYPRVNSGGKDFHHLQVSALTGSGEVVGLLKLARIPEGFGDATISVDEAHEGKGIGTELWRRAAAQNPTRQFVHNDLSAGGFALASKMARENPRQHVVLPSEGPEPGCTGRMRVRFGPEGSRYEGLQHDGGTCPIHEAD